jgi:hypothetical protein
MAARKFTPEREVISLADATQMLLDECRMVLPGIQALFGFQLIAVFSERFARELSAFEQRLHFVSIALVVLAIAIIMTPAAYRRHQQPREVTGTFIDVSTLLVLASMVPLAMGLSLDFYLIGRLILDDPLVLPLTLAVFAVIFFLWFFFPRMHRLHVLISRRAQAP